MARRRSHKKTFPCGHTGLGTYCHRCAQQQQTHTPTPGQRKAQPEQRRRTPIVADDPIDLRALPYPSLVERARTILAAIQNGEDYRQFNGKSLAYNKDIISIPLGYSYRLILRKTKEGLYPLSCDSHETYNKRRYG